MPQKHQIIWLIHLFSLLLRHISNNHINEIFFCDPSVAVAAMGVNADALETQLKTFGFIFEQMCVRDLRAYTADFHSHISAAKF